MGGGGEREEELGGGARWGRRVSAGWERKGARGGASTATSKASREAKNQSQL